MRTLLAALALFAVALPVVAQSLESALSPGPLSRAHQKVENECGQCHVRFDRAAQDGLCLACHKDVGQDLRQRTGMHGRVLALKPQPCRACHTEHRGHDMKIAEFARLAFDHRQTDYVLRGKHVPTDCAACHPASRKYRDAPSDCMACHRKDDKHKASLGTGCADCHTEQSWKEARIDHAKTRFSLTGKHADTRCDACHKSNVYKEAPLTCIGCHRKDDKHKARYGEKCESCHGTRDWRSLSFRHDTDARYPLRGKHAQAKCDSCHTGILYRDKLGSACVDCHRKDDKHAGTLGSDCAACHTERNWRETGARFDHEKSRFALRGGHVNAPCQSCHKDLHYRQTPSVCIACHRNDDKHQANLGTDCAACHTDTNWKATRFDHARTRFALREAHRSPPLACESCHRSLERFRPTAMECVACHRKDDRHDNQLGARCASCHSERNWRVPGYDHSQARFALAGAHVKTACKDCHASARFRDAPRECIGCHQKHDKHKLRFGERCESCHGVRDWRSWDFDHAKRSSYRLDAGHAKVPCEDCHVEPAPRGSPAAAVDRACIACHRRDDVHDGNFGPRCEQCHLATRWQQITQRRMSRGAADGLPMPTPGAIERATMLPFGLSRARLAQPQRWRS